MRARHGTHQCRACHQLSGTEPPAGAASTRARAGGEEGRCTAASNDSYNLKGTPRPAMPLFSESRHGLYFIIVYSKEIGVIVHTVGRWSRTGAPYHVAPHQLPDVEVAPRHMLHAAVVFGVVRCRRRRWRRCCPSSIHHTQVDRLVFALRPRTPAGHGAAPGRSVEVMVIAREHGRAPAPERPARRRAARRRPGGGARSCRGPHGGSW